MSASACSRLAHAHCWPCCPAVTFFPYLHPLLVFLSHTSGPAPGIPSGRSQEASARGDRPPLHLREPLSVRASCLWPWARRLTVHLQGAASMLGIRRPFPSKALTFHTATGKSLNRPNNELLPLEGHCHSSWLRTLSFSHGNDGRPRTRILFR